MDYRTAQTGLHYGCLVDGILYLQLFSCEVLITRAQLRSSMLFNIELQTSLAVRSWLDIVYGTFYQCVFTVPFSPEVLIKTFLLGVGSFTLGSGDPRFGVILTASKKARIPDDRQFTSSCAQFHGEKPNL